MVDFHYRPTSTVDAEVLIGQYKLLPPELYSRAKDIPPLVYDKWFTDSLGEIAITEPISFIAVPSELEESLGLDADLYVIDGRGRYNYIKAALDAGKIVCPVSVQEVIFDNPPTPNDLLAFQNLKTESQQHFTDWERIRLIGIYYDELVKSGKSEGDALEVTKAEFETVNSISNLVNSSVVIWQRLKDEKIDEGQIENLLSQQVLNLPGLAIASNILTSAKAKKAKVTPKRGFNKLMAEGSINPVKPLKTQTIKDILNNLVSDSAALMGGKDLATSEKEKIEVKRAKLQSNGYLLLDKINHLSIPNNAEEEERFKTVTSKMIKLAASLLDYTDLDEVRNTLSFCSDLLTEIGKDQKAMLIIGKSAGKILSLIDGDTSTESELTEDSEETEAPEAVQTELFPV
jgi:hypothetical protein